MRKEERLENSVAMQGRALKALQAKMKELVRNGYLDRFVGRQELDGCDADPELYSRVFDGFDPLVELAVFGIRPDVHKPLRIMALREVARYTHTPNEFFDRMDNAQQITGITVHIENYASGKPAETPAIETRVVVPEIESDDG